MKCSILPGVFDITPNDTKEPWRSSHLWSYVEQTIHDTCRRYGFQEIRTPIMEKTELFQKSTGESSDIVTKEMYTFVDKGERSITLRPEGTPPVMRSFIEKQMQNQSSVHKLYYIGPMFRYERPQAGRYRQHHQFGAEAIGNDSAEQDAEVIDLLLSLYSSLGLKNLKVYLNSLGDVSSRIAYRQALIDFLSPNREKLSPDSQKRLETNPLRILDSKDPGDRALIAQAPSVHHFLSEECRTHFEQVKKLLNTLKIPYEVNATLVRGLDYYTKTVFEVVSGELGAQNTIGAGGRYDGLMKQMGGPDLPSIGFGSGIERIIQTMINQGATYPEPNRPTLYLIALGEPSRVKCFELLHQLRLSGHAVQMDFSGKKLQKAMQSADQCGAQYCVVVGEQELETGLIQLKQMSNGETTSMKLADLGEALSKSRTYV